MPLYSLQSTVDSIQFKLNIFTTTGFKPDKPKHMGHLVFWWPCGQSFVTSQCCKILQVPSLLLPKVSSSALGRYQMHRQDKLTNMFNRPGVAGAVLQTTL